MRRTARSDAAHCSPTRHNSGCEEGAPFCTVQIHIRVIQRPSGTDPQRACFQRARSHRFLEECLPSEARRSRQVIRSALATITDKMKFSP